MAKQRRPQPKSARAPSPIPAVPAARPVDGETARSSSTSRSSTYFEAVALYERAVETLQRHDYHAAASMLESVLRQYPDEKELHERVRLYQSICQRQLDARASSPQTVEERLFASTLAINGGRYDEAIGHLRLVRDEDPDNDHALYMLAVSHAQRGEHAEAIAHLERAIAINPDNRALARQDPDLEPLREDDAFRSALETAALPRTDRRRPFRTRSVR